MKEQIDVSQLPTPQVGDAWLDLGDDAVGTTDYVPEYHWRVRIVLQVKIENGVIVDARCCYDDDEYSVSESVAIATAIVSHVKGRTTATVPRFADNIMLSPSMAEEVIYSALHDWATKRVVQLPPEPPKGWGARKPLWRRALSHIPPFGWLGV